MDAQPAPGPGPAPLDEDQVREALTHAVDPCSVAAGRPMNLVEMGLVDTVDVDDDGQVRIGLSLTSPSCMMLGQIMDQIDRLVMPLTGGRTPTITFDDGLSWTPERITGAARTHRDQRHGVVVQLSRRGSRALAG